MAAPRIAKGGTRGTVYREVAIQRLKDAGVLLRQARFNGAVSLAGYAIECQLKYAYCQRSGSVYLPAQLEVHNWDALVVEAQLLKDVQAQRQISALYQALVDQWGPSLRYRTSSIKKRDADHLYSELEQLYKFFVELVP